MRLWKSKTEREWAEFLRVGTEEEFRLERIRLRKEKLAIMEKMRDIQHEIDRRYEENPPDPGMVVRV